MNMNQAERAEITQEIIRRTNLISTLMWRLAEMEYRSSETEISFVKEELKINRDELHRLYADLNAGPDPTKDT